MTPVLRPYSSYKPTGVEWLGNVPTHWQWTTVKRHYDVQLGKMLQPQPISAADVQTLYLKAQHVQWTHIRTVDLPSMWASQRDLEQFSVRYGDLLVCEGGEGGRSGLLKAAPDDCIIQNALHRVRPKRQARNGFLQYVMMAVASSGWIEAINNKATIAHFTKEKFDDLHIPVPPIPEQTSIVRYLDHADSRIQRYISAKERLIELLAEQKQVTVNQAVTSGLNPDVRLRPSGVDWLGDLPAHWEVRRLKTICEMKSGVGIDVAFIEPIGEYPVFGGNGIRGYTTSYTHDGEFALIGRQGALCGNIHVAKGRFWASEHAVVAKLHNTHSMTWFGAVLEAMNLNQYSISAAQPGLSVERVLNLSLPVPPTHEQATIARRLGKATTDIDTAISHARRQSELMQEYRTRLIADVVTGKLDVRDAMDELDQEIDIVTAGSQQLELDVGR